MTPPRRLRVRQVGNLVNLSTPLGLLLASAGQARLRRGPDGLLLAEGYRWRFPVAGAFTIGNVVLTRRRFDWPLGARGPSVPGAGAPSGSGLSVRVLAHEGRHAWQWLACGPLFLPAYGLALGWSWWRTGNTGSANLFEQLAGLADGGYPPRGTRRPPRRPRRG